MSLDSYANRFVCDLVAYEPGKPIEETARELGLEPEQIVKVASNENPLGPSPAAVKAINEATKEAHIYPDGGGYKLRTAIAEKYALNMDNVVLGNGSNEIIELLCHTFLNRDAELIAAEHAFVVYKLMATLFGAKYVEVTDPDFIHDLEGMADAITDDTRLVFIANPNNPTGTMVGQDAIDRFMDRLPEHVVAVFDEAYFEFPDNPPDVLKYVREGRNACVLRTFSKMYGMAGLRLGWAYCPAEIANLLYTVKPPYGVNTPALVAGIAAVRDLEFQEKSVAHNSAWLPWLQDEFRKLGLEPYPSVANFFITSFPSEPGKTAGEAREFLAKRGIMVRNMADYGEHDFIRVSIGQEDENRAVVQGLTDFLNGAAA